RDGHAAGRSYFGYRANKAGLIPNLHVIGAERVITDHAIAVTPIEPAAIGIFGEKLVRVHTLLGLQFAKLQNRLALGQRVIAQVSVLDAIQKARLRHPKIMAYPGDAEQCFAIVRGADALNRIPSRGEIRRKRVPDAPDVAAALETNV